MENPSTQTDPDTENYENQIGLNYLIRNHYELKFINEALNKDSIQLNYQNNDGDTALHLAVEGCNEEVVDILVRKGAHVDIENNCHQTPITIVNEKLNSNTIDNDNVKWNSIKKILESGTYSSDSSNKPRPKRSGSHLDISTPARKRPKMHFASGFKTSLHGIVFQLRLLMLFASRAIKEKLEFEMASEMNAAKKFDDIVFMMKDQTRFLQAKHKLDCESDRITINRLKSTLKDEDFSLKKYFISFCFIKKNEYFDNSDLDEFIIITNNDFDFIESEPKSRQQNDISEVEKWRNYFKKVNNLEEDKILYIKESNAVKYKFNMTTDANELKDFMKMNLLSSVIEMKIINQLKSITDALNAFKITMFEDLIMRVENKILETSKESATNDLLTIHEQVFGFLGNIFDEKSNIESFEKFTKIRREIRNPKLRDKSETIKELKEKYLETANQILHCAKKTIEDCKTMWKQYNDIETEEGKKFKEDKTKLWNVDSDLREIREKMNDSNDLKWLKQPHEALNLKKHLPETFTSEILNNIDSNSDETKMKLKEKLEEIISEISVVRIFLSNEDFDGLFDEFLEKFCFITNYPNERNLEETIDQELSEVFNLLRSDMLGAAFERKVMKFLKYYNKGMAKFSTHEDIKRFFKSLGQQLSAFMACGLHKLQIYGLREYDIRFQNNPKELQDFIDEDQFEEKIFFFKTTTPRLSAIKVLQTIEASNQYKKSNSYIFTDLKTLLTSKAMLKEPQEIILHAFEMENTHSLLVIECDDKTYGENAKRLDVKTLFNTLLEILIENASKKLILIAREESDFDPLIDYKNFGSENFFRDLKDEIYFRDLEPSSQSRVLEKKVNFQESDVALSKLIDETSADAVFDQITLFNFLNEYIAPEIKVKIGDKKAFTFIDYVEDFYIPRQFILPNNSEEDENYFYEKNGLKEKVIMVACEAGMGKSTVLTSIANNIKKKQNHLWIVRMNLNQHAKSLSTINFDENGIDEAIKFITNRMVRIPREDTFFEFQQNLFKIGLNNNNGNGGKKPKIVIIFDGFDEVSQNIESATILVKALRKSEVTQLWISTRAYKKDYLEEQLDLPVHTLGPLKEKDQTKFASDWWKWRLKHKTSHSEKKYILKTFKEIYDYLCEIELPQDGELRENINKIENKFSKKNKLAKKELLTAIDSLDFSDLVNKLRDHWALIEDENFSFTENPLHLTMLTEVIYEKKFELPESFGLFYLYDEFIKLKFYIYYKRKGEVKTNETIDEVCNRDSDNLRTFHRTVAVNMKMFDNYDTISNKMKLKKEEYARVGLLKFGENELEFIHRSFAEFFYSTYLIKNQKNKRVQERMKNIFLRKDDHKLLRQFIEKNPKYINKTT